MSSAAFQNCKKGWCSKRSLVFSKRGVQLQNFKTTFEYKFHGILLYLCSRAVYWRVRDKSSYTALGISSKAHSIKLSKLLYIFFRAKFSSSSASLQSVVKSQYCINVKIKKKLINYIPIDSGTSGLAITLMLLKLLLLLLILVPLLGEMNSLQIRSISLRPYGFGCININGNSATSSLLNK